MVIHMEDKLTTIIIPKNRLIHFWGQIPDATFRNFITFPPLNMCTEHLLILKIQLFYFTILFVKIQYCSMPRSCYKFYGEIVEQMELILQEKEKASNMFNLIDLFS